MTLFISYSLTDPVAAETMARKLFAFYKTEQEPASWRDLMNNAQHAECIKDRHYLSKAHNFRFAACHKIVSLKYKFKKGASRSKDAVPTELPALASDGGFEAEADVREGG